MQNFRPPAFVRDGFRWRGRLFHLTYAYHIDPAVLLARVSALSAIPVLGTSIVHEESDAENPYDHTHFAWLWERPVDLVGSRIMDVIFQGQPVHPIIATKKSLTWMLKVSLINTTTVSRPARRRSFLLLMGHGSSCHSVLNGENSSILRRLLRQIC